MGLQTIGIRPFGIKRPVGSVSSQSWSSYWATRLDTWHNGFGFDTYTPDAVSVNDLTNIQWYAQSDIQVENVYSNYVLAFRGNEVMLSDDNGTTYKYRNYWVGKGRVEMSRIFTDGSISWAVCDDIFYSHDFLATINKSSILTAAGANYVVPFKSGNNYRELIHSDRAVISGLDIHAFANYGNTGEAAVPSNFYYTIDKGATYKIFYTFGTYAGVGDAGNPLTVRHSHVINFNPATNKFYAQTGDGLVAEIHDCRWMECDYTVATDVWSVSQVAGGTAQSYFKSAGIGMFGNDIYVGSDCTGDNSKWNVLKGSLATIDGSYSRIFTGTNVITSMTFYRDGTFIGATAVTNKVLITKDYGQTFVENTITNALFPAGQSFIRFSERNNNGWLKANYTSNDYSFRMTNALWIKIK